MGSIEGRGDLAVGRLDTDLIKPQKAQAFFTALSYNADGQFILAGGHSKTICIYHVDQTLLIKKFEVTQNRSFDAMDDVISRKKMSEFGNLALVEDREDPRGKSAIKYEHNFFKFSYVLSLTEAERSLNNFGLIVTFPCLGL